MVLWTCSICGSSKRAPARIRLRDVRRFCLPCSVKTGKLVDRMVPAIQRKQEKRTATLLQRRQQKRTAARIAKARKRKQEQDSRKVYPGILYSLRDAWARLRTWECDLSAIKMKVRRRPKSYSTGHAWYMSERIVVTAGTNAANGYMVLVHELAHQAGWVRKVGKYSHHETGFWGCMRRAAEEILGVEIPCKPTCEVNQAVEGAFRKAISEGKYPDYVLKPKPKPKPKREPAAQKTNLRLYFEDDMWTEVQELLNRWRQYESEDENEIDWREAAEWIWTHAVTEDNTHWLTLPVIGIGPERREQLRMLASDLYEVGAQFDSSAMMRGASRLRKRLESTPPADSPAASITDPK